MKEKSNSKENAPHFTSAKKSAIKASKQLSTRVRQLRKEMGASQRELAQLSGISFSAISKIENNQLSPTYDSLVRLANGFNCDITDLFNESRLEAPLGRRSITRKGEGHLYRTNNYSYELLCNDISHKKIVPLRVVVKAKTTLEFGRFSKHEGEEFIFVISGTVEVHTQFFQPEILQQGDCIYFDSTMEHACINKGDEDAEIIWIATSSSAVENSIRKQKHQKHQIKS